MSATILVRQLGPDGEPQWGAGQVNFLADRLAVAQLTLTRLRLLKGEWWANKLDGLPLWQSILGAQASAPAIALLIQSRILGTAYVTGLSNLEVTFDKATRRFTFSVAEQTQFGAVAMSDIPAVGAQGLP